MEIKFNNVSYIENPGTSYEKKYLNDVTFSINSNKITGIIAKDNTAIPELISAIKRPTMGEVICDSLTIKKNIHINDVNIFRRRVAIINCSLNKKFLMETVEDEIGLLINNYGYKKDKKKRIEDSLKMVGLDNSFLKRNPNELSSTEQNKISFASVLSYNPEVLIFVDYETGFTYKEKQNFKRLLKIMKNKYNKTIIVVTKDVEFLLDLVDNYIVINNGEVVTTGTKDDFYNDDIYKYYQIPKIIEFIKIAHKNNHDIEKYIDIKELIKGIYRDVS